jgi:hypothetical protein
MPDRGVAQDDIATLLELDPKTSRKHVGGELDRGSIEATAKVGQSMFRMATEGGSVAAAIFWMKARAGWRENHDVKFSGQDGETLAPLLVVRQIVDPQDGLGARPVIDSTADAADANSGDTTR